MGDIQRIEDGGIEGLAGGKIANDHSDMVDQAAAISFPVQHATLLVNGTGWSAVADTAKLKL